MQSTQRPQISAWPGGIFRILLVGLAVLVLNLNPHALALAENLGGFQQALDGGTPRTALVRLEWVLEHEPWRGPVLWRLVGQAALAAGDPQVASEAFLLLEQAGQALSGDWLALGDAAWQLDNPEQALLYWQRAVDAQESEVGPEHPGSQAARRIVDYYRAQHQYRAEAAALSNLVRLYPNQEDYFRLGLLLLISDPQGAADALEAAAAFMPGEESSQPASIASRMAMAARAAAAFDEPAYVKMQCGRLLGAEGYWTLAYVAFYDAVWLRPDMAEAWAYLAEARQQILMQAEQDTGEGENEARRWLEYAYQVAPESLAVNALFGLYWMRQDNPDQALAYFEQAKTLDPLNPLWWQTVGSALAAGGDLYNAQAAYQKAVDLDPSSADGWRALAEFHLHYEIQLKDQGLPAAQRAAALDPGNPANQDAVGLALLLLGSTAEAETYFQAALALDAAYVPALLHLGGVYLDRGDKEKAEDYLSQANELLGENPKATLSPGEIYRLQTWLNELLLASEGPE